MDFADAARDSKHLPPAMIPSFEPVMNPPGPAATIEVTENLVANSWMENPVDVSVTLKRGLPKPHNKTAGPSSVDSDHNTGEGTNPPLPLEVDLKNETYMHKSAVDLKRFPLLRGEVR